MATPVSIAKSRWHTEKPFRFCTGCATTSSSSSSSSSSATGIMKAATGCYSLAARGCTLYPLSKLTPGRSPAPKGDSSFLIRTDPLLACWQQFAYSQNCLKQLEERQITACMLA